MNAVLNSPRVHSIRRAQTGPWIEVLIHEPDHDQPNCIGTVELDLDGLPELTRFMKSLNKSLNKFIDDEG